MQGPVANVDIVIATEGSGDRARCISEMWLDGPLMIESTLTRVGEIAHGLFIGLLIQFFGLGGSSVCAHSRSCFGAEMWLGF